MKVGDLVKIYNYTENARAQARQLDQRAAALKDVDAHRYGLIIKGDSNPKYGDYREVLRSCDGESEFYNVVRLEVV